MLWWSAPSAGSTRGLGTGFCRTAPRCARASVAAALWISKKSKGLTRAAMKSRLQEKYRNETVPALMKHFGWKNMMAVPKLQKVTVNIGLGEASQNVKLLDTAAQELGQITGQKAIITRAKKSIASFKIRKSMTIGCSV